MASDEKRPGSDPATSGADDSPAGVRSDAAGLPEALSDQRWSNQVGPALTAEDVAKLLGRTPDQLCQSGELLAIESRQGQLLYPVVQFDGGQIVPGLKEVLRVLAAATSPAGALAWLTGALPALDGQRPIDVLRTEGRDRVLQAARRRASVQ